MYTSFPISTDVSVQVGGMNDIKMSLVHPVSTVPTKPREFLEKLGWSMASSHPDTGEMLYQKHAPDGANDEERKAWNYELASGYWFWYEAIAYEFSKFMSIEEDTGGSAQDEQPVGSSPR